MQTDDGQKSAAVRRGDLQTRPPTRVRNPRTLILTFATWVLLNMSCLSLASPLKKNADLAQDSQQFLTRSDQYLVETLVTDQDIWQTRR